MVHGKDCWFNHKLFSSPSNLKGVLTTTSLPFRGSFINLFELRSGTHKTIEVITEYFMQKGVIEIQELPVAYALVLESVFELCH